MSDPIVVLHAEDMIPLALYITVVLNQFGYKTVCFSQTVAYTNPSEIAGRWSELLSKTPAAIILFSEPFLKNSLLLRFSYEAKAQKKAIFVDTILNGSNNKPNWFPVKYINLSPDRKNFNRGLNQLVHEINRSSSYWSYSPEQIIAQDKARQLKIN